MTIAKVMTELGYWGLMCLVIRKRNENEIKHKKREKKKKRLVPSHRLAEYAAMIVRESIYRDKG